ncbi:MAG: dTDP-4-dehydrorhamnose 3,5-epimerase [candidate division WOR-3 bacterium]
MTFKKLSIPDVILISPKVLKDKRGLFAETYKKSLFDKAGIRIDFVQENYSKSKKNVLRGLHYQIPPYEQAKLVSCIRGKIFDVVVDIRKNSPFYGKWVGVYLSSRGKNAIYIPEGFAHGYLVLSEEAEIIYKVSKEYSKEHERGILWNDPEININWPLSGEPILSEKDKKLPAFTLAEKFDQNEKRQ